MHSIRRLAVALAATMLVLLSIGPGIALAVDVQHGIGLTKGCASPTKIGDPYSCSYTIRNILDEAQDTLTIHSIVDIVHAASGNVNSGNIIGSVQMTVAAGATCAAASGDGSAATPYTGVTSCTLPFGSRVNVLTFSHYTVQAADFGQPNHQLRDDVLLGWGDQCNDPAQTGNSNCDPTPPTTAASSLTLVQQLASSTATDIHNDAHQVVTTVAVGTTVHDFVTVTGQPGSPVPTGNVNIDWFLNGTCSGDPASNSGSIGPLDGEGMLDATGFHFTVNNAGMRSFKAHYEGDATYTGSVGACEPLTVVDANIQITPNGVNPVGSPHTFTAHVNVNDGTGFTNAPNGTEITFTTVDTDGATSTPNPPTSCTTAGGTGSCDTTIVSPTTGVSTVSAHTTVTVGGVPLTRETAGVGANSLPAVKNWTDRGVTTTIHAGPGDDDDADAPAITSALVGSTVHDQAFVTGSGDGTPTGTVSFTVFLGNTTCAGEGSSAGSATLLASGFAHPSNDVTVPAGGLSFMAHYSGDNNFAAADGPCEPLTATVQPVYSLFIDKSNDAPIETLELPDGTFADLPTKDEGGTVIYTLQYTLGNDPVTNGIIWDKPPVGVTVIVSTVTDSNTDEFIFDAYRTDPTLPGCATDKCLIWKAAHVTSGGTMTYHATVDVGASELAQPLHNPVFIISDQTPVDDSASDVYVPTIPKQETDTPPPTDAIVRTDGTSTPGLSLWLALAGLGVLIVGLGFITPVPARVRRRRNR